MIPQKPNYIPQEEIFQGKKCLKPEGIFFNAIAKMIYNLIIDNPNSYYSNTKYYRADNFKYVNYSEHAQEILEEMQKIKHLINL